ncbi:DNA replication factor C, large subunit [Laetiporus sulphureus 93-53]|uniref:Replication factor C subunit 1 n=1 Tax=Laetiporus sulphureus 93-53 TaxID=1314785 RepID=A0A165IM66_9APHY|nr:DNA replication factor C, large subunit [Laetiporus sulphureus 93-53]KZT13273.1 DNA replication factor C, large subunit [Laetiporus sulphureus 93-53]
MANAKTKVSAKHQGKDIRGFFGGSSQTTPVESNSTQRSNASKGSSGTGNSKPIEISDEDDPRPSAKTATSSKAKKAPVLKSDRVMEIDDDEDDKPRRSVKRKKAILLSSDDEDEDIKIASPPRKKAAIAAASSSKASHSTSAAKTHPKPKESTPRKKATRKKRSKDDEFIVSDSESEADDFEGEDVDEEEQKPRKGSGKSKGAFKKVHAKPHAKAEKAHGHADAKSKPAGEEQPKKFNWYAAKAAKAAGPIAPGSKPIPQAAAPDCLAGLSFVFTGELTSLSRDEAVELAKRHGGRVTGQPSSKTSYVVVGTDAGPSKLAAIKKNNLKTLDEDGFLNLIATRVPDLSQLDEKTKKKLAKEKEAIREAAAEMEKREKKAMKESMASGSGSKPDAANQLWTDRYAPQTLKEVCGNKGQVEKLQRWLHDWSSNLHSGFKKPGKDGMGVYRAVLITGPPGIGKTTSAHLCAKLEGFTPIELNASDSRSKKLVENSTNIANTSLDGWMHGEHATNAVGIPLTDKSCLIMDEVDGMSAGDRGGVGALAALIRKTRIPIICIANDRGAMKLKPLINVAYSLAFRRPEANAVRSRILSIAFKEKMKIPANVIDQLIEGAQSDIRQVLNMLSTWKLSSSAMDFDEGKRLAKANEKYSIMTPFDITHRMLGPYMFSATSRETLNDKIELYFHDFSFVPLFIQENYLKTQPAKIRSLEGPEKVIKQLELMDKAAASISDGDIVDAQIHGPEQYWSLMPLHAICSTVRPASLLYGGGSGYGGPNATSFPQWLGQNSKQTKLTRQLTEVQARMRLKISGDRPDIRQSYVPALFPHIVQPLMDKGANAIDDVIEWMDDYFLSREEWDTIVELGLDEHKDALVLKKIPTATKTAFTRKYNSKDHPIPFHKAFELGKVPKKVAVSGPLPDLEEALEVDEEIEETPEGSEEASDDVEHDTLIVAPKAGKGKAKAKGKAKK